MNPIDSQARSAEARGGAKAGASFDASADAGVRANEDATIDGNVEINADASAGANGHPTARFARLARFGRFARFAVVGAIGFLIDTWTTLSLVAVGVSPFAARIPGLGAAVLATWMLNRTLTFRAAGRTTLIGSLSRYLLVAGSVALVNYALYSLLLGVGLSPLGAIVVATACSLVLSYLGYGRFAFRGTVPGREPD